MWQEVRITLTVLNLASEVLSYFGGTFEPNDYFQGCKLSETYVNRNCISFNDDMNDDTHRRSRNGYKPLNHIFFENDSENDSKENISPIKQKSDKYKKLDKSFEQEVIKYIKKEKKDKRRLKTVKEVVESESVKYTSNICVNDKFMDNENLEEFKTPKSKCKKKSKRHNSQSSTNEDVNEECAKHLSKEISKTLSDAESDNKLNRIKLKLKKACNGLDWNIVENTLENKVKLKKSSRRRKDVNSSDYCINQFDSYNYIPYSGKWNSKSFNDSEEESANIKMEKIDDTKQEKNKIKRSFKKKRNMDLETSKSDKIQNTKIKTGRLTENTQDEDYAKVIEIPMDTELGMSIHTFSSDLIENGENETRKKQKKHFKNKIKVESKFEEIVTNVKKPDNKNEDIYQEDLWNSSKIVSLKKKRKVYLGNSIKSNKTDAKSNTKYFNKTKTTDKE